jgi:DNA-binding transcriptional ArsR family regulator
MPPTDRLPDEFLIADPETLKVMADSLRLEILRAFKRPSTVKEVGDRLEMPPTKLYYHVNLMEKHGLIRVVETNIVSGIIEKRYQAVARSYRVDDSLLAATGGRDEPLDQILGAMFSATQSEIRRSVRAGLMQLKQDAPCEQGMLLKSIVHMNGSQTADFCRSLHALVDEVENLAGQSTGEEDQANTYGITIAFYPISHSGESAGGD